MPDAQQGHPPKAGVFSRCLSGGLSRASSGSLPSLPLWSLSGPSQLPLWSPPGPPHRSFAQGLPLSGHPSKAGEAPQKKGGLPMGLAPGAHRAHPTRSPFIRPHNRPFKRGMAPSRGPRAAHRPPGPPHLWTIPWQNPPGISPASLPRRPPFRGLSRPPFRGLSRSPFRGLSRSPFRGLSRPPFRESPVACMLLWFACLLLRLASGCFCLSPWPANQKDRPFFKRRSLLRFFRRLIFLRRRAQRPWSGPL